MRRIRFEPEFAAWQEKARTAVCAQWAPETVFWDESGSLEPSLSLFEEASAPPPSGSIRVPKRFLEAGRLVALHSSPHRWPLLYRILWRLTHGESRLLENPADSDFIQLVHLEKEVGKDAYRMTAFLRFREVTMGEGSWFVAWYEPEHDTIALNAEFFRNRFSNMRWSILTPRRCMHWDGNDLRFSEGVDKSQAPTGDDVEPLWISYYSHIFNPARLKVRAMQAQLLKRNWKNLPEAAVIEPLIRNASRRTGTMIEESDFSLIRESDFGSPHIPSNGNWNALRDAAAHCRACPLWKQASCTVFGEGRPDAQVMLVGEQPGDQEDRSGKPFVGPAGQLLDRALSAAGVDRSTLYVTNAVKHFKFEPRGKRRIHKSASAREIAACRLWLEAELQSIQPRLVVALGSTATHALFGSPLRIMQERGALLTNHFGLRTLVTVHPSSLLRLPDGVDFETEFQKFVNDLRGIHLSLEHPAI